MQQASHVQMPIVHVRACAPEPGPLAPFSPGATTAELGLPGLGMLVVHVDRIEVHAPDADSAERTWARIGIWATAQWLLAQGFAVLRGSAVAKDGRAIAILGGYRSGTSITAAELTKHGWQLLSDGCVAIDADGTIVARSTSVRLDQAAASRLFAGYPMDVAATGRPRVDVSLPSANGRVPLAAYVALGIRGGRSGLSVSPTPADDPVDELYFTRHLGSPDTPRRNAPTAPAVLFVRSQARSMQHLREISPVVVAQRALEELDQLW